ncbi:DUF1657 domain-containing protein [Tepidibacter formicigenes]|jgi:hypothetical protein|uniref:DUF1657 domain-containing protein n=1 Tax=Tepidibacter formicigenes DSM 15518 TaxID=1123349 RepID=A0A1M6MC40_9FIRM|nr:DUF1657 domain-containing protein [Tepidibacter formicigenes]SHJ80989.1 Protein of unknown function [Tepidibacter formicigenes DSM 15518]
MTVGAKVKQTLANLKGTQSTLRLYSIQTQDKNIKDAYKEALKITDKVIHDLEERIKVLEFEEPQYKGY